MQSSPESPSTSFSWSAHPARDHVGRAAAVVVVIGGLALLAALIMKSLWWGIGAAAILLVALNRFFFRSRFAIDEEGITAQYPLRRQRLLWPDLRRFVLDDHGGYLSTRARRSRLDAYRGMHLYFGEQRRTAVERIRAHLPEGAGSWA